jgi:hypothetical protein
VNDRGELLSDAFHLLAQPIVALRARVELGLLRPLNEIESRRTLESCLVLLGRLMGELALVRELATLEAEEAPLEACDGLRLVKEIVEELAPVAEEAGITLRLDAEPAWILASEAALRRALFVLLDATLGTSHRGGQVTLALRGETRGEPSRYRMDLRPGVPPGGRRELCRKLVELAGGNELAFDDDRSAAAFRTAADSAPHAAESPAETRSARATCRHHDGDPDSESGT